MTVSLYWNGPLKIVTFQRWSLAANNRHLASDIDQRGAAIENQHDHYQANWRLKAGLIREG